MVKKFQPPLITAEIGYNHKGDFNIALELIELSKECKCNYAKFQKRNPKELLSEEQYNNPHPNPHNSYGDTYGAHREFLELNVEQHRKLKEHCEKIGIGYTTSVWDITSANEIIAFNPNFIKVPSACNNHFEMLKVLRDNYSGDVHISTGMTTKDEIEKIVLFFEETDSARERIVLYNCTSGYPVPFEDICMLDLNLLYKKYQDRVKNFGFSGHHLGIAVDIAAYTLGANWVERHFTKDRTWKGTDHAASLEPAGMRKLVRDLNATHQSLTYKTKEILPIEQVQRDKLKFQKS